MSIRISELTPKEATLSPTDLLEISEETPDGFVSKSITGAEIIEAIPVFENNPKMIASVNGLNLTGNTNQISASVFIPAGTIVTNNTLYIQSLLLKSAGSTTSNGRVYLNTSNSLTGATLLGTSAQMTGTNYIQNWRRNMFFDGTHLNVYLTTGFISSDLTVGGIAKIAFNTANDYFLIFAVQNSTTTPDNLGHKRVIVQIYD